MAIKQLKILYYNDNTIKLIVDLATIKYAMNIDTLGILDLNGFHLLIDNSNLYRISYLDFAIYKRKIFSFNILISSPMHIFPLGMYFFFSINYNKHNVNLNDRYL